MNEDTPGVLLTGGIGSGKSTAAGILGALGAAVISADEAAHRVLDPDGPAFHRVAGRWPEVVRRGHIDRSRLAALVFEDPVALRELESATHPAIRRLLQEWIEQADGRLIVVEVPLLQDPVGRGWPRVVVDAPDEVRRTRLLARGMSEEDVRRRMAAQPGRAEWLAAAEHVLDNSGDLGRLADGCRRLWDELMGS